MEIEVGGQIQGISLGSFLQIVHMDKTTCTLKIYSNDDIGYLYIKDGALVAAETGHLENVEAAYEILSWNKTVIIIDNAPIPNQKITVSLMNILMEGLRRKDEKNAQAGIVDSVEPKELEVEFDPDTYVSKDDQIASQFVVSEDAETVVIPADALPDLPEGIIEEEDISQLPLEESPVLSQESAPQEPHAPEMRVDVPNIPIREEAEAAVVFEDEEEVATYKPPLKSRVYRMFTIAAVLVAIVFGGLFGYKYYIGRNSYDRMIAQIKTQKELGIMKSILTNYISTQKDDNRYVNDALTKINDVDMLIDVEKKLAGLSLDDSYRTRAEGLYKEFLNDRKDSFLSDYVQKKLDEIPKTIEAYDFKKISTLSTNNRTLKMKAYKEFLTNHPDSKNTQAVKNLIAALSDEFYSDLSKNITVCTTSGNWDRCIELSSDFVTYFGDDPRANEVSLMRDKIKERAAFVNLKRKASTLNFTDAKKLYNDFIQNNPETTLNREIRDEIIKLNRNIELQERWSEVRNYCMNPQVETYMKMKELKEFIDRDSDGMFKRESGAMMRDLKNEERVGRDRMAQVYAERQERDRVSQLQAERERINAEREKSSRMEAKRSAHDRKLAGEAQRLSKQFDRSGRFRMYADKTVTDTRTGLMWTMVDSYSSEGECMDFDQAREYIRNLNYGGYTDWRMPDGSELAVLYNSKPYFPSSGAKWYWTSRSSSDAWGSDDRAIVFFPDKKDEFVKIMKDKSDCGYVHPVRP
jgi:hypothetical protein